MSEDYDTGASDGASPKIHAAKKPDAPKLNKETGENPKNAKKRKLEVPSENVKPTSVTTTKIDSGEPKVKKTKLKAETEKIKEADGQEEKKKAPKASPNISVGNAQRHVEKYILQQFANDRKDMQLGVWQRLGGVSCTAADLQVRMQEKQPTANFTASDTKADFPTFPKQFADIYRRAGAVVVRSALIRSTPTQKTAHLWVCMVPRLLRASTFLQNQTGWEQWMGPCVEAENSLKKVVLESAEAKKKVDKESVKVKMNKKKKKKVVVEEEEEEEEEDQETVAVVEDEDNTTTVEEIDGDEEEEAEIAKEEEEEEEVDAEGGDDEKGEVEADEEEAEVEGGEAANEDAEEVEAAEEEEEEEEEEDGNE